MHEEVKLAFQVELETRKLTAKLANVEKALRAATRQKLKVTTDPKGIQEMAEEVEGISTNIDAMGDSFKRSLKPYQRIFNKRDIEAINKSFKRSKLAAQDMRKGLISEYGKIAAARAAVNALEKNSSDATVRAARQAAEQHLKDVEDNSKKEITVLRSLYKEKERLLHEDIEKSKLALILQADTKSFEEAADAFRDNMNKGLDDLVGAKVGKDIGEGFSDTVEGLKSKDIFGLIKGGNRLAASLMKGAGSGMQKIGAKMMLAGDKKGGALGKASKGLGAVVGSMGQAFSMLAKLGPILSVVGSGVGSLIKLFIDIEAKAKEMNKEILDGAATLDLYAESGYRTGASMQRLDGILATIKDQASDPWMNMAMGTQAKDHLAYINVLSKEGLTLKNLDDRLGENKTHVDALSQSMTQFTDISKMAIGYSRAFGVSVDEIAGLQVEMMTEMGVSLQDTKLEFIRMGNAAADSGIAANKFFSILRGVSSDLGLYGARLGEVTSMLGKLGKVMSPRMAQKFVTSFAQGMKNFSTENALHMTLIGGKGAVDAIKKDLLDQKAKLLKDLAAEAGVSPEEAEQLFQGKRVNGKTLSELAKAKKVTDVGSKIGAYDDVNRGIRQAGDGAYGAALASKNMTASGSYKFIRDQFLKFSGKQSLEESTGIAGDKRAQVLGLTEDIYDTNLKIERMLTRERQQFSNAIENPGENKETIAKLSELIQGFDGMTAEQRKVAAAAITDDAIINATPDEVKPKEKTDAERLLEATQKQGERTSSIMDKLDNIFDAIFNHLYKVMLRVWDAVTGFWADFSVNGAAERKKQQLERAVMETKNSNMMKLLDETGGDWDKFHGAALMNTEEGRTVGSILSKGGVEGRDAKAAKAAALKAAAATEKDPAKKKVQEAEAAALLKEVSEFNDKMGKLSTAVDKVFDKATPAWAAQSGEQAAYASGFKNDPRVTKLVGILGDIDKHTEFSDALSQAGFTEAEAADIKGKAQWADITKNSPTGGMANLMSILTALGPASKAEDGAAVSKADATKASLAPASVPSTDSAAVSSGTSAAPPSINSPTSPPSLSAPPPAEMHEDEKKHNAALLTSQDDIHTALRKQGIKIDKSFLENQYQKSIREGVLDASRQALLEFATYTAADPSQRLEAVKKMFGESAVGNMASNLADQTGVTLPKNAEGGVVTGISNGMATVSPAAGEGLASIGRGEQIVPAGSRSGSGGNVTLVVQGISTPDLAKYLENGVNRLMFEYKRREKYT